MRPVATPVIANAWIARRPASVALPKFAPSRAQRVLHSPPMICLRTTFALLAITLVACGSPPNLNDAADSSADAVSDVADEEVVDVFVTASHTVAPQIPMGDVGIITNPTIIMIAAQNDPNASRWFAFSDALAGSAWWRSWAQEYGANAITRTMHVTGPAMDATTTPGMTDTALTAYALAATTAAGGPAPNPSNIYMLTLPQGIYEIQDGTHRSNETCTTYRAFHSLLRSPMMGTLAVVQHCPLFGGETDFDEMTAAASHEIAETVTDPTGSQFALSTFSVMPPTDSVWLAFLGPGEWEIGDLCAGTQIIEGGFAYQRIWSNAAAMVGADPCVPAAPLPYFGASAAQEWFPMTSSRIEVPITGWSTGPTPDFAVSVSVRYQSHGMATADWSPPATRRLDMYPVAMLHNGSTANVAITVSGMTSGDYAVVWLATRPDVAGGDFYRPWLFGVYMP